MGSYGFSTTAEQIAQDWSKNIEGKVILITGAGPGSIAFHFAQAIVPHKPKLVIIAGRNLSKCSETVDSIKAVADVPTRTLELNLADQAQIRKAAAEVNEYPETIDVLCNSAGVMACPYGKTKDGIEMQFGTNHIGHFLFTNLIMPKLLSSKAPRILSIASDGCRLGPVRFDDYNFDDGKTYDVWRGYGQSKTANALFALSLATALEKRHPDLRAYSIHPGVIVTSSLGRHMGEDVYKALVQMDHDLGYRYWWDGFERMKKTGSQGAASYVYAAFCDDLSNDKSLNGRYIMDCHAPPHGEVWSWVRDPVEAQKLWKLSEELVGQNFDYAS